jgi:uncharacterized protein YutE (UPF0331/DUF86 family)
MVNRNIIDKALETIRFNVGELRKASDITLEVYLSDLRSRRFVERSLHVIIEACVDIAHHIISDEGFRESSSYRDAFIVLNENGIIPEKDLKSFERIAMFRNLIVHYYEKVDDEMVYGVFKNNLGDFERFIGYILNYMDKDVG